MAAKFALAAEKTSETLAALAPVPAPFAVSERAAKRLAVVLAPEGIGAMMRVAVEGGGCSGFQYKFSIDKSAGNDDIRIEREGITVLVDAISAPYLAGSELDYVTEMLGQSFQIKNPNATAKCGCGTSFSV